MRPVLAILVILTCAANVLGGTHQKVAPYQKGVAQKHGGCSKCAPPAPRRKYLHCSHPPHARIVDAVAILRVARERDPERDDERDQERDDERDRELDRLRDNNARIDECLRRLDLLESRFSRLMGVIETRTKQTETFEQRLERLEKKAISQPLPAPSR